MKRFPFDIGDYLVNSHWLLESRPIGLFLSEHGSASFLAAFFFGFAFSKRTWLLDLFLLFKTGVATPFATLFTAKVLHWNKSVREIFINSFLASILFFCLTIFCIYLLKDTLLEFLLAIDENTYSSGLIIISQMFDSKYLFNFLSIFPGDILGLQYDVGVPELGYTKYSMEYGLVFFFSFLFILLKKLKSWRIFILISLFHNHYP